MPKFNIEVAVSYKGPSGGKNPLKETGDEADRATKKLQKMQLTQEALIAAGPRILAAIGGAIRASVAAASESQDAFAQLKAGVESTGKAAGFSAEELAAYSSQLQKLTGISDETIQGAQSLLLTFTKIAGDTFPRATRAVLDMSTRMGGDLKGAAIQVGKALNDPIKGVTALGRAGVQFSKDQKEAIAALVETGQLAKAQEVILRELETQFGGSAIAARDTLGGALKALNIQMEDLAEIAGEEMAPALKELIDDLTGAGSASGDLQAQSENLAKSFGQVVGVLIDGAGLVLGSYSTIRGAVASALGSFLDASIGLVDAYISVVETLNSVRAKLPFAGQARENLKDIAAFKAGALADAKAMAESFHEVAVEQLALGINTGGVGRAAQAAAGAVGTLAGETGELGEQSGKAAKATQRLAEVQEAARARAADMIDDLRREAEAREARLGSLQRSPKALLDEVNAQERQQAVLKISAVLQEQGLRLTEEQIRLIPDLVGRQQAATAAEERLKEARERNSEAMEGVRSALAALADPTLKQASNADDLRSKTADLKKELDQLVARISTVVLWSTDWLELMKLKAEAQGRLKTATEDLAKSFEKLKEGQLATFGKSIASIEAETAAILGGRSALEAYNRELAKKAEVERLTADITPLGDETVDSESFKKRLAAAQAEARAVVDSLFTAQDMAALRERLMEPLRQVAQEGQALLADALFDVMETGGEGFDELWDNFLKTMKRALAQWLVEWAVTVAKAKAIEWAAQLGSPSVGGQQGGGGGWMGWAQKIFNRGGQQGGQHGWLNQGGNPSAMGGIGQDAATIDAAAGGNSAAGGLSMGAIAGYYAAIAAVFLVVVNQMKTSGRAMAAAKVELDSAGQFMADTVERSGSGAGRRLQEVSARIKALGQGVKDFLTTLGASLEGLSGELELGRSGQGKKTNWFVRGVDSEGNRISRDFGRDVDAAMEYLLIQVLKNAETSGLTPLVQQAIKQISATTSDELQRALAPILEIDEMIRGTSSVEIRKFTLHMDQLTEALAKAGVAAEQAREGFEGIASNEISYWEDRINNLFGREQTPEQLDARWERERQVLAAELELRRANLKAREAELQAQLREIEFRQRFSQRLLEQAELYGEMGMVLGEFTEEQIAAMRLQLDAIRRLLGELPEGLPEGERPRGNSGGGNSAEARRQALRDLRDRIQDMRNSALGEPQQIMADLERQIRDFREAAREAGLPAAELTEGIRLLGEAAGRALRERIAPYLNRNYGASDALQEFRRNQAEIDAQRRIPRGQRIANGGPRDWELNEAQGNILDQFRFQTTQAIDALIGLSGGLAATNRQADGLRRAVREMGLSAEETDRLLAQIDFGVDLQRQNGINGVMDRLFGYLKESGRYAQQALQFEKDKIALEFILMRAELEAYGAWRDGVPEIFNAAREAALLAAGQAVGGGSGRSGGVDPFEAAREEQAQRLRDLSEEFKRTTESLREFQESLRLDDQLSGLSPQQQLAEAENRYRELQALALSGDVEARAQIEGAARDWLTELRDFGTSAGVRQAAFEDVDALLSQLINATAFRDDSGVLRPVDGFAAQQAARAQRFTSDFVMPKNPGGVDKLPAGRPDGLPASNPVLPFGNPNALLDRLDRLEKVQTKTNDTLLGIGQEIAGNRADTKSLLSQLLEEMEQDAVTNEDLRAKFGRLLELMRDKPSKGKAA